VAKTLDTLVDEVRLMLKDRRLPYRYTQSDVLNAINSGYREAKRIRPDIFVNYAGGIALPDFVEGNLGSAMALPIDEKFFMPIVFYAVGKLQLGDDQFAIDNRAMTLLSGFRNMLLGA
jgi:hypothetical protein